MNTNVSNIVNEWSYRLSLIEDHNGFPDVKSYGDLTVLKSVLTDYEWSIETCYELFKKMGNKVIIGEMSLDQKNVEKLYKEKKLSKDILKSANKWIKGYIKKIGTDKYNLGKASLVSTTAANIPQIKGGNPNRIEFTIELY